MIEKLHSFFKRRFPISDEQFAFVKTLFIPKKVKKGELLIRAGEMAKYGMFVAYGCLRTYTIDERGKEHILQFSPEDWWTGDMNGMVNGAPSTCFIDAIEDSQVLLFDNAVLKQLTNCIPQSAPLYQMALQKSLVAKNQRIVASLSASAEERYEDFLRTYPSLVQRVSQQMIASYLGITPETLSRIRKKFSQQ